MSYGLAQRIYSLLSVCQLTGVTKLNIHTHAGYIVCWTSHDPVHSCYCKCSCGLFPVDVAAPEVLTQTLPYLKQPRALISRLLIYPSEEQLT